MQILMINLRGVSVSLFAGLGLGVLLWLVRSGAAPGQAQVSGLAESTTFSEPNQEASPTGEVAKGSRIPNIPLGNTESGTAVISGGSPPDDKRRLLAAEFEVEDFGRLDAAETARVAALLRKRLDDCFRSAQNPQVLGASDIEAAASSMVSIAEYQDALDLFLAGEYLTVEPMLFPKKSVPGRRPMVLMSSASLGGKRVGVLLPLRIQDGSDLNYAVNLEI
jgi:hypothetical protein